MTLIEPLKIRTEQQPFVCSSVSKSIELNRLNLYNCATQFLHSVRMPYYLQLNNNMRKLYHSLRMTS